MIKIKKLKSISETEKRTDIIIDDPKFKDWFNGSKVIDSKGKPLVCFHGTKKNFNSFRPLSHFGTVKAANDIIYYTNGSIINMVYLSIKNPLKILDYGRGSIMLPFDLYSQNIITQDELLISYDDDTVRLIVNYLSTNNLSMTKLKDVNDFIDNTYPGFTKYFKVNSKNLISIMSSKRYDGFFYTNVGEDTGSISWIIFNSNQVWPIYRNKPDGKTK